MKKYIVALLTFLILPNLYAENVFEKNFQQQGDKNLKSLNPDPQTEIYRGWDKDKDNIMMLEEGYDLIGFSSFAGTYVPPAEALDFGKQIKADTLLVYDRQINEATRATAIKRARENIKKKKLDDEGKIEEIIIDPNDLADSDAMFDFYVSYWAKLPKPLFGTHLISFKEDDERYEDGGLFVVAVIKDSAAASSGIERKDRIMTINGISLKEPNEFIKELIKNKGNVVEIAYMRDGNLNNIKVQI